MMRFTLALFAVLLLLALMVTLIMKSVTAFASHLTHRDLLGKSCGVASPEP